MSCVSGIQKPYYYNFLCVNSEDKTATSSGGTKGIKEETRHIKGKETIKLYNKRKIIQ